MTRHGYRITGTWAAYVTVEDPAGLGEEAARAAADAYFADISDRTWSAMAERTVEPWDTDETDQVITVTTITGGSEEGTMCPACGHFDDHIDRGEGCYTCNDPVSGAFTATAATGFGPCAARMAATT